MPLYCKALQVAILLNCVIQIKLPCQMKVCDFNTKHTSIYIPQAEKFTEEAMF